MTIILVIFGIVAANCALAVCALILSAREDAADRALREKLASDLCKRGASTPRKPLRLV